MKVARVSTVTFFVATQLRKQINDLVNSGIDVTIIAGDDDFGVKYTNFLNVDFIKVSIDRKINIFSDCLSLLKLIFLFKCKKFDIVHSTTPKAGLLCALAGWITRVPVRIHTFTGQPWIAEKGMKKWILILCDKIIGFLNTQCYTDSASQRNFLIHQGIIKASRLSVICQGSLAGVDITRFNPEKFSTQDKCKLKSELGISDSASVILFVGRVAADKGINELLCAFKKIILNNIDCYLLIVGPMEEEGQVILNKLLEPTIKSRLKIIGFSESPENYMSIANIFCIPSYREGFGTVVIEAAAMKVPSVGSDIYGLSDAIINHETGILVPVRNCEALYLALTNILINESFRLTMANKAYNRVLKHFDSSVLSNALIIEYKKLLKK